MNLIIENINKVEGSFYEKLYEEGLFDLTLFVEVIFFIDKLNKSSLTNLERLNFSNQIWELSFSIQESLGYSYSKNDAFEIINLEENKLVEIGQLLYYICKSFKNNEELDMIFINHMLD